MNEFAKIYASFFTGSMRTTPPHTRLVFQALLLLSSPEGLVRVMPDTLAGFVGGISEEQVLESLRILQSPDPDSASPEEEGRRIVPWGMGKHVYRIVNYQKYRRKDREQERLEYKREWDRANRSRASLDDPTESDNPTLKEKKRKEKKGNICNDRFDEFWAAYPRRAGGNPKARAKIVYRARVKEGVSEDVLIDAVKRYAAFCEATRKVKTEYVKQAASWLSPTFRGWEEDWEIPQAAGGETLVDRILREHSE